MGKQSEKTSTVYGNTTTKNPYVQSHTDNSGTNTNFVPGTALETIYNFVNKNMGSLLDEYINPNINSTTNKAKLKSFTDVLEAKTLNNLENDIINPLSNRNMIRSSQATDLYKNLESENTNAISSYINHLISESQNNTAKMLNNLLSSYLIPSSIVENTQKQSLDTSIGNATKSKENKSVNQLIKDIQATSNLGGDLSKILTTFI